MEHVKLTEAERTERTEIAATPIGEISTFTVDFFCEAVKTVNAPIVKRLEALEQKIAALEARPLMKWAGVWLERTEYRENNLTTDRGGLWLAVRDTTERPGDPGGAWRLIVKRGEAPR